MKSMANNKKANKCHFNLKLKGQNNEVSITKNQMVAKRNENPR